LVDDLAAVVLGAYRGFPGAPGRFVVGFESAYDRDAVERGEVDLVLERD